MNFEFVEEEVYAVRVEFTKFVEKLSTRLPFIMVCGIILEVCYKIIRKSSPQALQEIMIIADAPDEDTGIEVLVTKLEMEE